MQSKHPISPLACTIIDEYLRFIQPYLDDETVIEIMINTHSDVWIETCGGTMRSVQAHIHPVQLRSLITTLLNVCQQKNKPLFEGRFRRWRIAAALHPVSTRGDMICIRKPRTAQVLLEEFSRQCTPSPLPEHGRLPNHPSSSLQDFLVHIVQQRAAILIGGSTSSGKTTLLQALLHCCTQERIISLEETPEIALPNHHWVPFQPTEQVELTALIRFSLRCRPDRIIIGEVRGQEAWDTLSAYNTGHTGGIATLHAHSAQDTLYRFENMVLEHEAAHHMPALSLRTMISRIFRYVLYCQKQHNGKRHISEVLTIDGLTAAGDYQTKHLFFQHA